MRLRRDAKISLSNGERACSHIIHRTQLNMADTWSEEVEARLITSWQKVPLLYDVADKHYLNHVFKKGISGDC